tara:strand:+ start:1295 stop:2461 length:1167 start_codon:yes stop_codon:yes gene_type:complete
MKTRYISICLIFVGVLAHGQDYNNLVKQKENLVKESKILNQVLLETQKTQKNTLEKLNLINTKIELQNNLLLIYNQAINVLKTEQTELEVRIFNIETNLEKLKKNYAKIIQISNRSISGYNRLLFFLSSNNFNQLLRRLYHFKQLATNRRKKYKEIQKSQTELNNQKQLIIEKKAEQAELALNKKLEIKHLSQTKKNQETALNFLINKKDSLKKAIKIKEIETKKITKEIVDFLESEKKKGTNLTPELKLISSNFKSNKGRLPWPVQQGSVVSKFGEVPHPVLSGIMLINNGIEIATNNYQVRAIFNGEVSRVIILPTGLKVVIIKHGEYLTVYSQLYSVSVQKGQKIQTKDHIGLLNEGSDNKNNTLGFQIWKGREKLNPAHWISSY